MNMSMQVAFKESPNGGKKEAMRQEARCRHWANHKLLKKQRREFAKCKYSCQRTFLALPLVVWNCCQAFCLLFCVTSSCSNRIFDLKAWIFFRLAIFCKYHGQQAYHYSFLTSKRQPKDNETFYMRKYIDQANLNKIIKFDLERKRIWLVTGELEDRFKETHR